MHMKSKKPHSKKHKAYIWQVRIVIFMFLFIAVVILGKLFNLQVMQGEFYKLRGDRQYVTPASAIFERGSIYMTDKDGKRISAATQRLGFRIALNTREFEDDDIVFENISPLIDIEREYFDSLISRNDGYEEVANKVSDDVAEKVRDLNLDGVKVFREKWRYYPGNDLAAHALGFLAYDTDTRVGQYGLERYYEKILARDENQPYINFFAELFTNVSDGLFEGDGRRGDIVTTIEPSVQSQLEIGLESLLENFKSDSAGGIVVNPQTGEVYALAVAPDFDINNFGDKEGESYINPLTSNVFELGSVIKPLVMASALNEGVVTADTSYFDKGYVDVGSKRIENFDKKGRGQVTMQDVLNQSLNTGMVLASQKLGNKKMREYLYGYGFNSKTGIDLPAEISSLTSNLESRRDLEFATASFGQGIAVTPVSAVRAFSALANKGIPITPHVVKYVDYNIGGEEEVLPLTLPAIISPETAEEITRMLVGVVDTSMTQTVKKEHYSIGGKTGTAQMLDPNGGYHDTKRLHSFFGYFPAYDPQFLIFLYTVDPKGVRYSSQSLAPLFAELSDFLINYYSIPPDR